MNGLTNAAEFVTRCAFKFFGSVLGYQYLLNELTRTPEIIKRYATLLTRTLKCYSSRRIFGPSTYMQNAGIVFGNYGDIVVFRINRNAVPVIPDEPGFRICVHVTSYRHYFIDESRCSVTLIRE